MYLLFTNCITRVKHLVQNFQRLNVDQTCKILFPNLFYENGSLYEISISKGYIYNSTTRIEKYTVEELIVDHPLQNIIDEYSIYASPKLSDSDSDSESDSNSDSTADLISTLGYSPNLVSQSFCGFGFHPTL